MMYGSLLLSEKKKKSGAFFLTGYLCTPKFSYCSDPKIVKGYLNLKSANLKVRFSKRYVGMVDILIQLNYFQIQQQLSTVKQECLQEHANCKQIQCEDPKTERTKIIFSSSCSLFYLHHWNFHINTILVFEYLVILLIILFGLPLQKYSLFEGNLFIMVPGNCEQLLWIFMVNLLCFYLVFVLYMTSIVRQF